MFKKFLCTISSFCMIFSGIKALPVESKNAPQLTASSIEKVLQDFQEEGGKTVGSLLIAKGEEILC